LCKDAYTGRNTVVRIGLEAANAVHADPTLAICPAIYFSDPSSPPFHPSALPLAAVPDNSRTVWAATGSFNPYLMASDLSAPIDIGTIRLEPDCSGAKGRKLVV
jgi:hypothetical protein